MSATDSDAFGRCKWCGNMTDSAGCLTIACAARTASEAVTAPTPDAVAQARLRYEAAIEDRTVADATLNHVRYGRAEVAAQSAWAEVLAAVRAECAAKVRALPGMEDDGSPGDWENYLRRGDVLDALEAHP